MMKQRLFVSSISLLLLFGKGWTFSLSSLQQQQRSTAAATTTTKLFEKKNPTFFLLDENYDYDELMNSPSEQTRLKSQYVHFGHENWLRHRASDRFYRNLFKFAWSPIVQNLIDEVAVLILISLGIIFWNESVIDGYLDFNGIHHDPLFQDVLPNFKLSLPSEPFFLCSGPLGLLVVFRNDASFQRYREAFHLWEKVVSTLSNMLLMASTATPKNVDGVRNMGLASWALCRTLQHEVSGNFDPKESYEQDIRQKFPEQAEQLLTARNKLYRGQYNIHQTIEVFTDEITVLDKRTLINSVNEVANLCVECERLYTTPIPLLYTRHTLKFLTFWMTLMPLAFYDIFKDSWNHIFMLPAIAVLTFLFFGIEEIAASLEEPFSILPLKELVEDLELNIQDTTQWMEENQNGEETTRLSSSNNGEAKVPVVEEKITTNGSS